MENKRTIGTTFLQIALGLLFIVSGIWTVQGANGDDVASAIKSLFSSADLASILCVVFGVIEIVVGFFLLLRLFVNLSTALDTVLMVVIMLSWIVMIVMMDFIGSKGLLKNLGNASDFCGALQRFAMHLLVLGAIIKVKD
ncbi:MAG: DoxX family membrane protein [Treponema sp.]|nr:DoxX family membrane protein [Treponema sp.]